jgi:ribosomal protein S18 acetylase RimI-like enzyme
VSIAIRSGVSDDADAITRTYLESADLHARLDPERYAIPTLDAISARYRDRLQSPPGVVTESITLVAEVNGEVVGFVDARLERSPDAMHREMVYCHIEEIAVSARHQNQGAGARLLQAAEEWGRRQGATLASLDYHVANAHAAEFYQRRMGYRVAAITVIKNL